MILNELFIEMFEETGLTQREFARRYKISYSAVNHWINFENPASFKKLEQVAKRLNKTIKIEII